MTDDEIAAAYREIRIAYEVAFNAVRKEYEQKLKDLQRLCPHHALTPLLAACTGAYRLCKYCGATMEERLRELKGEE